MPYEDFTAYTEYDPDGLVAVSTNLIDADGADTENDPYVYRDFGADHFGAEWEHDVKVTAVSRLQQASSLFWGVANGVGPLGDWGNAVGQALGAYVYPQGWPDYNWAINLRDFETADADRFEDDGHAQTTYYCTVNRLGETALQLRIYSDAERTVLLDTLAVTVTSGRRYRYAYGLNTAWSTKSVSVDVENLDLHEEPPTTTTTEPTTTTTTEPATTTTTLAPNTTTPAPRARCVDAVMEAPSLGAEVESPVVEGFCTPPVLNAELE